jgi:hypothetical protein
MPSLPDMFLSPKLIVYFFLQSILSFIPDFFREEPLNGTISITLDRTMCMRCFAFQMFQRIFRTAI